jgi:hypothetical protein
VPERIYLRSEVQDCTSRVERLAEILADWNEAGADAEDAASGRAAPSGRTRDEGIASKIEGARGRRDRILSRFR